MRHGTRKAHRRAFKVFYVLALATLAWTLAVAQNKPAAKKGPPIIQLPDAPIAFDNKSNGMVDDPTHQPIKFDGVES